MARDALHPICPLPLGGYRINAPVPVVDASSETGDVMVLRSELKQLRELSAKQVARYALYPMFPCGCKKCEEKLPTETSSCCKCVCDTLCVTISIPYDDDCDCNEVNVEFPYDTYTDSWHGTIVCGGLSVDLDFEIKKCNDKCYICLTSDCLGMPYGTCPDDCVEFTPSSNNCRGTFDGIVRTAGLPATWNDLDFSGCGDTYCGTGSISVVCADRVLLQNICDGCDCVDRCLCASLTKWPYDNSQPGCDEDAVVCFDESINGWDITFDCSGTSIRVVVTIEKDEYGDCILVTKSDVLSPGGSLDVVDQRTLECPNFSFEIDVEDYADDIITIGLRSLVCGTCGVGEVCCGSDPTGFPGFSTGSMPGTLFVTVHNIEFCGCADGSTAPLTWNGIEWEGSLTLCEGSDCNSDLTIRVFCDLGGGWHLRYTHDYCGCDGGVDWTVVGIWCDNLISEVVTCDPFEFRTDDVTALDICCCEPVYTQTTARIYFTVTE